MEDFHTGDIVCLTFDESKRFMVSSGLIVGGKIEVSYFSEYQNKITEALINPQLLMRVSKTSTVGE